MLTKNCCNRTSVMLTAGIVCLAMAALGSTARAQSLRTDEEKGDFQLSTGITLSLTGPKYFYEFRLVDQSEFEYDTWSVVHKPSVVDHVQLSQDQMDEMKLIRELTRAKLIANLAAGAITASGRVELESQFRKAELELRSIMTAEQQQRLEQIQNQLQIQQVGIVPFLNAIASREDGLFSDQERETMRDAAANSVSESLKTKNLDKARLLEIYRTANKKWLSRLSTEQQSQFERFTSEDETNPLLSQPLLTGKLSQAGRWKELKEPDLARLILMDSSLWKILEIQPSQLEQLEQLKTQRQANRKDETETNWQQEVANVLTEGQYQRLVYSVSLKESSRYGTLTSLCGGTLGKGLKLDDLQREQLFEFGKSIDQALTDQLAAFKRASWESGLANYPPALQQRLLESIGAPLNLGD